jgi:hypothetical protein
MLPSAAGSLLVAGVIRNAHDAVSEQKHPVDSC